jgi:hypothetical protein
MQMTSVGEGQLRHGPVGLQAQDDQQALGSAAMNALLGREAGSRL